MTYSYTTLWDVTLLPTLRGVAAELGVTLGALVDPPGENGVTSGRERQSGAITETSRLRKKGKALSRSVWSLNCLGGIRHVIGQFK